jgi:hypothetical protein
MRELRDWLIEGDPVTKEPPLSEADVQRMRRAIADAGETHVSSFSDWARGSWATATVVVALTIAVGMTRWFTPAAGCPQRGCGRDVYERAITAGRTAPGAADSAGRDASHLDLQ